jgi:hypothetical protein
MFRIVLRIDIYGLGYDYIIFFRLSMSYFFCASSKISHKKKKDILKNYNAKPEYSSAKSAHVLNKLFGDLLNNNIEIFINHSTQSESLNFLPAVSNS